ncbi:acriflavin resistance protein [Parvibaculum lavamentivorans DS-1]|uniref:Acriflavin resistance protein n=1 Tax=Parvibaculum lavamentivorans (strain DS-1 / DSM 13023 / NCIMB 13966) TaxID=402881 RepID=A7HPG5_PARL1|nr:efflux RND transporter permease subunit [Parvibaculum lavamentivorans]ABS61798.1 acriflavin resistance protein [Parvibaculum lavamentivorans DS-1]
MKLSDVSVTRPVFAAVISLLLVAFGLVAFDRLPLREYPDIDPPIVSITTDYRGAAAAVVETRITERIEERIAGIEGIAFIQSSSQDGRSRITIEFNPGRDVDAAANDIRDRVSGILDDLPTEADPPDIQKVDSSDDVIMWLNVVSDRMNVLELTDYAERHLVDRFSTLDGVARVRLSGARSYAMRIWLDRTALAARELTVGDVEQALRAENVELPAGNIESTQRQFTARVERSYRTPQDFSEIVLAQGSDGYLVRLGDVARIERAAAEERTFFRGNEVPMIGLGIIKQSTANTLTVTDGAKAEAERLAPTLPEGLEFKQSFDSSVFIEGAISEVYKTLGIAIVLVVLTIFVFLGSARATLVPAVTVPVSVVATFLVLYIFGFSINLLTLLALVLAIGLVVDDTIVVLENIYRRMEEGATPLVAAYRGARQVGFAVIATTIALMAVFVPLTFIEGEVGRLFSEFAITMAAAVGFSSLVALSLSPMLASKILKPTSNHTKFTIVVDNAFERTKALYARALERSLMRPLPVFAAFAGMLLLAYGLFSIIPSEYAPREDRGTFFVMVNAPEGSSYAYTEAYMTEIEKRLMPLVEDGEISRLLVRAPRSFGNTASFNDGIAVIVLEDWSVRRSAWDIMNDIRARTGDLPGVTVSPVMRAGFGGGTSKPVQFVIGGGTYEELREWRDILLSAIDEDNPGLINIDHDYKETKPQLRVEIDRNSAGDLGVTVENVGRTLETIFGSRLVTTYIEDGEEYDVILEGERSAQRTPSDMSNIFVRSERSGDLVPLANLVTISEMAGPASLNRYNRVRSITIEADLEDGLTLGQALDYLEGLVQEELPPGVTIDYKGQSLDFVDSGSALGFIFILGIVVVFLVLAAQFESFVHPVVIISTVPLAITGGLLGIWLTGGTLNLYTQIGLIMLVGLAAKNGILIVEFANQLRDEGQDFREALVGAAGIRLRPILMTAITTAAGAIPLILSFGPGAETRAAIGVVIFSGIIATTAFTLFVVPVAYQALAQRTGSPGDTKRRLETEMDHVDRGGLRPRPMEGAE